MRHQNSVFHDLQKHVPWAEFDRFVEAYGADARVRRLTTKSQLMALLYAQFSGASSLREIEAGLRSHAPRLYHLGAAPARRSTLADANALRPAAVFADLFARMAGQAHRGLRRALSETTYLIDSTGVRLTAASGWARFSAKACGAKVHVIYDADADRPIYAAVTAARVNDITAAQAMPIEAGATYVFDLGYYDYAWWAKMDAKGCRIVTRFKANTPLACIAELAVPEGGAILSDRIGHLPARQANSRKNPFGDAVREIRVRIATGKVLRILSNNLDATAQEIADLYKRRWTIELFFRWIKQNLRIRRFYGRSENAVQLQIAAAVITYLLWKLSHTAARTKKTAAVFLTALRNALFHRIKLETLGGRIERRHASPDQVPSAQLEFAV